MLNIFTIDYNLQLYPIFVKYYLFIYLYEKKRAKIKIVISLILLLLFDLVLNILNVIL